MCSLLQAKDFTKITPVRQIIVLVPRFDREFVMTLQRLAKMAPDLNSTMFFNEGLTVSQ